MDFICRTEQCTGCFACFNICPLNAIDMVSDEMGFKQPRINNDVCVNCGKCKVICPQNNEAKYNTAGEFYAGVSFDDEVKEQSSSGGIFSLLAEKIIRKGGVVFGAAFDDNFNLKHIAVDNLNDLHRLRGSKYVQSEIRDCFTLVKDFLGKGRKVLFSGTPCQIDGLYSYLSEKPDNLYTVDVLCHGVPSPDVFERYFQNEIDTEGQRIKSIDFRSKKTGWVNFSTNINFEDNSDKTEFRSSYMYGFLNNYYLRESCYDCRYANKERVGDITLGDFWGYKEKSPSYLEDDDRGISLVIVNNTKGKKMLKSIRKKAALVRKSYDEAAKGNPVLNTPCKRPANYCDFHNDYNSLSWSKLTEKYFTVVSASPTETSKETETYISHPFRKRYYKHLLFCKKQELVQKIKKGK